MSTVYYKRKLMRNSGQVTPFMVLVIAVLLLAIAATMLIGEVGFQRVRLANVDDAALISGTSSFCRALNQIRMLHTRMFLNYLQLQVALLAKGLWPSKNAGYAAALGWSLIGIEMNEQLKSQANTIAKDMAKNLRVGLYDSILGGALVDEPKPFLESEIVRDPRTNRIIKIDYENYLNRDSHFTLLLRDFKKGTGDFTGEPLAGKDNWYKNNLLSYSFNKSKEKVLSQPGELNIGEPGIENFESYLRVELQEIPSNVSIKCQRMVLIFFYKITKPPGWTIGFIPHPCAWIRRIDIDSNNFGVAIKKSTPFRRLPFFPKDVELAHKNWIRIKGSVWTGFDFRMEEAR